MTTEVEFAFLKVEADIAGINKQGWNILVRKAMQKAARSQSTTIDWLKKLLREKKMEKQNGIRPS
jgi:hypothetical protein